MTKSELLNMESSLMEMNSAFMGDSIYRFSKEDIISMYKELAYSIEEYIEDNTFHNKEKASKEMSKFLRNNFFENLKEFSFSDCFDEDDESEE